jgi:hypothetical protein
MEMVLSFFARLYSILVRHGEDELVWSLSKRGLFEVLFLNKKYGPSFPWKSIWHVKAPSMVAFFVWTTVLGKILTHDNLRNMNVVVIEWFFICKKSGESIEHLLLHCQVAPIYGVTFLLHLG